MILIISTCSQRLSEEEFVKPIAKAVGDIGHNYRIRHYTDIGSLENSEKIIICGTALKDNMSSPDTFGWLKDTKNPVLGICSGMQIIAQVFGGRLKKIIEIGMKDITVAENRLFSGGKVYCLHTYAPVELHNFEILAESEKCIQAIKHKTKDIFGVLFHPEVRSREVIENFLYF